MRRQVDGFKWVCDAVGWQAVIRMEVVVLANSEGR